MQLSVEEARSALSLPRLEGGRSVIFNGIKYSTCALNRIIRGNTKNETPTVVTSTDHVAVNTTDSTLVNRVIAYEAKLGAMKAPEFTLKSGEHVKKYLICYVDHKGNYHSEIEKAKGMVTALTMFYVRTQETAVVSISLVV